MTHRSSDRRPSEKAGQEKSLRESGWPPTKGIARIRIVAATELSRTCMEQALTIKGCASGRGKCGVR